MLYKLFGCSKIEHEGKKMTDLKGKPVSVYTTSNHINVKYRGTFIGWGIGYERAGNGIGHFTTALIMKDNESIDCVHPELIKFN